MVLEGSRVLVLTLPMDLVGGVQSKARFLAAHLHRHGHHVTMASYAIRSLARDINVGWLKSFFQEEWQAETHDLNREIRKIYVGRRFPGVEFTCTENSMSWRRVLKSYDRIIAVGGTPLIAHPAASIGKPFILWCADDLNGDREARVNAMSGPRRIIDKALVMPKLVQQQSLVLQAGMPLLGVSKYTTSRLNLHVKETNADIRHMPIPIETDFFKPSTSKQRGAMGFAGRISDSRKNAKLLFEAFKELRRREVLNELHIAGPIDDFAVDLIGAIGISESVQMHGDLNRDKLRAMYQSLEVFAITSSREGLGISALEAMACGVPVVSTRCGGPEDFVKDGVTGYISSTSPVEFADCVCRLLEDKKNYRQMSNECRRLVSKDFSVVEFSRVLDQAWKSVWSEDYRNRQATRVDQV